MTTKAQQIIDGWKNWFNRDPNVEYIATVRATICGSCDRNKYNICTQCGCPLISKTRSTDEKCPLDKWPNNTFLETLKTLIPSPHVVLDDIYTFLKQPDNTFSAYLKENIDDILSEDNNQ